MSGWAARIAAEDGVRCGVRSWRRHGRVQLTIVVKATFTLVDKGVMTAAPPVEIEREDRTFDRNPTRSVEAAGDLAPHLPRCDVTFVGHAFPTAGAASCAARLAVFRDGRALLDKTVHAFGERDAHGTPKPFAKMPLTYERAFGGPGVDANPVGRQAPLVVDPQDPKRPASFAPISRFWPARKKLLGAVDREALDAPLAEVPESVPWAYFQAAPADQQIEYLRGGEWVVMDGLHPTRARLQSQIPAARAEAWVVLPGGTGASGTAVELVADTLAIDGDRGRCSIVWRGRYEVAGGEAALAGITVVAGLSAPGQKLTCESLFAGIPASAHVEASAPRAPPAETAGEGTLTLDPRQHIGAAHKAVAPFAIAAPDADPVDASATPWGKEPLRTMVGAVGERTVGLEDTLGAGSRAPGRGEVGEATVAVTSSPRPATPFAATSSHVGAASQSGSLAATPWGGGPLVPTRREAVGEQTMGPGGGPPMAPATPPGMAVAPPPFAMAPVTPPVAMAPVTPPVAMAPVTPPVAMAPVAPPVAPPPKMGPVPAAAPPPMPVGAPAPAAVRAGGAAPSPAATAAAEPPSLADRLKAAGASSADIEALLNALQPPPPPPPQD